MSTDIVLIEGARTPFAKFCGSFREISATDLGAIAAREAMKKAGIEPEEIDMLYLAMSSSQAGMLTCLLATSA
ncbi:3-ketoacyl-CoA thiolase [Geobacillus sp. WSUCF1]|nr:3-ketoacyl-CoA thiolase [Geobacillus sp. WSUCF1]